MIKYYLREVFTGFKRSLTSSVISVIGLSVGTAIFLLIMLYTRSEFMVNKDLPEYDNIYKLSLGDGMAHQTSPAKIGEILRDIVPEIKSFTRVDYGGTNHVLMIDEVPVRPGRLIYVDSSFFRLFSLPFIAGDPNSCLVEKFSIVITESLSGKLFGNNSPVGQVIRFDGKFDTEVTGVICDPGPETNIEGDFFMSFHSLPEIKNKPDLFDCYTCYNYQTYLLLEKNADHNSAVIRLNESLDNYGNEYSIQSYIDDEYSLLDMHNVYFGSEERPVFRKGNIKQIRMLMSIGILILIIAIINYINLATAQAGSRLRQMSIRKIIGAERNTLIALILSEAIFISMISMVLGLFLMKLIIPLFNSIMDINIGINYMGNLWFIPFLLFFGIMIGIISGLYPALAISRFNANSLASGLVSSTLSGGRIRKYLTIFQALVSVGLIGCTLIMYEQIRFIDKADLGFDKEILAYLPLNKEISERREAFRQELIDHSGVDNVSYSYASYRTSNEQWGFEHRDQNVSLHIETVDENYLSTLGLELISGRNFFGKQDAGKLIINEEASRRYFGSDPEGTVIEDLGGMEIIGVIRDFKFLTFDKEVEPIGLMFGPSYANLCNIRLSGNEFSGALEHIERTWNKFCFEYPFEYHFVDKLFEERYTKERSIGKLLLFFSIISVIIACLGIYGLATFTVMKRSKEVGIRKVNGASVLSIVKLLSFDINTVVLLSLLPAFLLVFFVMTRWLSHFAYHISMPWWIYLLAAFIVWLVALLSTVGKTIRTAHVDPVNILRTE